jgi:hypothetical protein
VLEVRPFKPYHIDLLRAQGVQSAQLRAVSHVPGNFDTVLPGVTAFDGDWVILCGGIVITAPRRGVCWALLGERATRHMNWLHYATKRYIELHSWQRLQASVEDGFTAGCRWLDLLGFHREGSMRNYGDGGETHLLYARYK